MGRLYAVTAFIIISVLLLGIFLNLTAVSGQLGFSLRFFDTNEKEITGLVPTTSFGYVKARVECFGSDKDWCSLVGIKVFDADPITCPTDKNQYQLNDKAYTGLVGTKNYLSTELGIYAKSGGEEIKWVCGIGRYLTGSDIWTSNPIPVKLTHPCLGGNGAFKIKVLGVMSKIKEPDTFGRNAYVIVLACEKDMPGLFAGKEVYRIIGGAMGSDDYFTYSGLQTSSDYEYKYEVALVLNSKFRTTKGLKSFFGSSGSFKFSGALIRDTKEISKTVVYRQPCNLYCLKISDRNGWIGYIYHGLLNLLRKIINILPFGIPSCETIKGLTASEVEPYLEDIKVITGDYYAKKHCEINIDVREENWWDRLWTGSEKTVPTYRITMSSESRNDDLARAITYGLVLWVLTTSPSEGGAMVLPPSPPPTPDDVEVVVGFEDILFSA